MTRANSDRITSIDGLRGISSIIIIMYHALMIHKLEISGNLKFIEKYFGHGVTLFFVISAFSLFLNYFDKIDTTAAIKKFFINRFARISPLFLFFLLLMNIRMWVFARETIPFNDLIINIFYIFAFFPGKHVGIVWASWAIGVLFVFYFTAPILMIFIRNTKYALLFVVVTVIAGHSAMQIFNEAKLPGYYHYLNFITQFPAFSFGILAFFCYRSSAIKTKSAKTIISLSGCAGIVFIYFALTFISGMDKNFIRTIVTGFNFSICAFAAAALVYSQSIHGLILLDNPISRFYGKISYSTYLIHPAVLFLIQKAFTRIYAIDGLSKDSAYLTCCLLTIIIVTPLAFLAQKFIESPGNRLLRKIGNKI